MEKIKGINSLQVNIYKIRMMDNNIGGLVFLICDIDEFREVLVMKFGDWQLFKLVFIGFRQKEIENEEVNQFEVGFN